MNKANTMTLKQAIRRLRNTITKQLGKNYENDRIYAPDLLGVLFD